jgi:hypothetical protein
MQVYSILKLVEDKCQRWNSYSSRLTPEKSLLHPLGSILIQLSESVLEVVNKSKYLTPLGFKPISPSLESVTL